MAKPVVFAALLVPLAVLLYDVTTGRLSANPIEDILHRTGGWGLRILLLTLAITPIHRLTHFSAVIKFRRMLGLFAFFYLSIHFSIYLGLDQFFSLPHILEDITKRPYLTVGFASLLLLVPLAITSTKGMIKRMGGRRWKQLHRLVYPAAIGGVVHFFWSVKADTRDPIYYAAVLAALLAFRLPVRRWAQRFSLGGQP